MDALINASRKKTNLRNRVEEATEAAVTVFALKQPAFGQVRVSNERQKRGIFISPSAVRSVWMRRDLESFKKRLAALERHVAQRGEVLVEPQVAAFEKKQEDDVAHGEIETAHPGYLGSQDTFYVGTIKGVGRIYQQTFVDIDSKWAAAKLYTTKTPIRAVELLNNRVLPVFDEQGMGMIRVLTDRGTEYCGKPEADDYQFYFAFKDIEHTKTKANHPQTNGICERFHKTILNEFYQVAYRRERATIPSRFRYWVENFCVRQSSLPEC